jgi:hypothetical protein
MPPPIPVSIPSNVAAAGPACQRKERQPSSVEDQDRAAQVVDETILIERN